MPKIKAHAVVHSFSGLVQGPESPWGTQRALASGPPVVHSPFFRLDPGARGPLGFPEGSRLNWCHLHMAAALVCLGRPMGTRGPWGGPVELCTPHRALWAQWTSYMGGPRGPAIPQARPTMVPWTHGGPGLLQFVHFDIVTHPY